MKSTKLLPKSELLEELEQGSEFIQAHSNLLDSLDLAEGVAVHLNKEIEKRDMLQGSNINKKIKILSK